ncbi:MAG TPA: hypothetical protein VJ723_06345 [Candidatus Angelobacter sp.]|nr:hypothetical protein [Candidatus Angelobacter sp.]
MNKTFTLRLGVTLMFMAALILGQARTSELQLTIQMDKSSYKAGEPILCRVVLRNVSDTHLAVNNRMLVNVPTGAHELYVRLTGPSGKTVPFVKKVRASLEGGPFVPLLPNHIAGLDYDLAKDHELTQAGTYTVRVYYENHSPGPAGIDLPVWQGTLESNQLTFNLQPARR